MAKTIDERIAVCLALTLGGLPQKPIALGTTLDELEVDSLGKFELTMFLEDEFDVTLGDDGEILALETIQDIRDMLTKAGVT